MTIRSILQVFHALLCPQGMGVCPEVLSLSSNKMLFTHFLGMRPICSISIAPVHVSNEFKELAHILVTINIPKQIQKEQTWWIVTRRPKGLITVSHQGSNE